MGYQRWKRESTHDNRCRKCNEAAAQAKTEAKVTGNDSANYAIDVNGERHTATMRR